ncbi:MAG: LysR family transcriptional regulator [Pseudomonadota bacterium]
MRPADTPERLFLAVVEAGSLKGAAERVGADPSAVSRRISALEARLGIVLLRRSTKQSAPTEAGARYYATMRRLVDEQDAAEAAITGMADTPSGRLRVAAPVDFGARFVAPVLSELRAAHPALDLALVLGSASADLAEAGIDVAVRIGALPDSALVAKRLGAVSRVLVAAPDHVARHGMPATPDDLRGHPFVFYRPGERRLTLAMSWRDRPREVTVEGGVTANAIGAIRAMVTAGHGAHLGPRWAFEDDLRRGALVELLPQATFDAFPLHALHLGGVFRPAKIAAFIDAMQNAVSRESSL